LLGFSLKSGDKCDINGNIKLREVLMNDIPKKSGGDYAHKAGEVLVSSLPVVGPAVAALFNEVIIPPLERRRDQFLQELYDALKELEEKVEGFKIENLSENEMFITAVMHASRAATQNHQQEKREALRNAVLNSASRTAPEEDLQLMFFNWIDELTSWHLRILKFFDSPENWVNKHGIEIPDWPKAKPLRVFFEVYPQMKNKTQILNLMIQDLSDIKELMDGDKIHSEMQKMAYLRVSHTTKLGKQFLKFITSPIEEK
jgi:hypothetical protein